MLVQDLERLTKTYLLPESDGNHVRRLQAELAALDTAIMEVTEDQGESTQAYSALEEQLEMLQSNLKDIEDEQISVSERLPKLKRRPQCSPKSKCLCEPFAYHQTLHGEEKLARYSSKFLETFLYCKS